MCQKKTKKQVPILSYLIKEIKNKNIFIFFIQNKNKNKNKNSETIRKPHKKEQTNQTHKIKPQLN